MPLPTHSPSSMSNNDPSTVINATAGTSNSFTLPAQLPLNRLVMKGEEDVSESGNDNRDEWNNIDIDMTSFIPHRSSSHSTSRQTQLTQMMLSARPCPKYTLSRSHQGVQQQQQQRTPPRPALPPLTRYPAPPKKRAKQEHQYRSNNEEYTQTIQPKQLAYDGSTHDLSTSHNTVFPSHPPSIPLPPILPPFHQDNTWKNPMSTHPQINSSTGWSAMAPLLSTMSQIHHDSSTQHIPGSIPFQFIPHPSLTHTNQVCMHDNSLSHLRVHNHASQHSRVYPLPPPTYGELQFQLDQQRLQMQMAHMHHSTQPDFMRSTTCQQQYSYAPNIQPILPLPQPVLLSQSMPPVQSVHPILSAPLRHQHNDTTGHNSGSTILSPKTTGPIVPPAPAICSHMVQSELHVHERLSSVRNSQFPHAQKQIWEIDEQVRTVEENTRLEMCRHRQRKRRCLAVSRQELLNTKVSSQVQRGTLTLTLKLVQM
jgi:hypothetical protein